MPWLTVPEAARYVRARDEAVRRAVASGELPAWRRPGGRSPAIVSTEDLDEWVRSTFESAACEGAALRSRAAGRGE